MATQKQIQALEDKVIEEATKLVSAVFQDAVNRGVTGLTTYAGNTLIAINNLRIAKKLPVI